MFHLSDMPYIREQVIIRRCTITDTAVGTRRPAAAKVVAEVLTCKNKIIAGIHSTDTDIITATKCVIGGMDGTVITRTAGITATLTVAMEVGALGITTIPSICRVTRTRARRVRRPHRRVRRVHHLQVHHPLTSPKLTITAITQSIKVNSLFMLQIELSIRMLTFSCLRLFGFFWIETEMVS